MEEGEIQVDGSVDVEGETHSGGKHKGSNVLGGWWQ